MNVAKHVKVFSTNGGKNYNALMLKPIHKGKKIM